MKYSILQVPTRFCGNFLQNARGFRMQPKERRDGGQRDLFKSRLDQIVNLNHALVRLSKAIDWDFLEKKFGAVYDDDPGRPPLPTRLMAGLAILKHMHNLSDEVQCEPARPLPAARHSESQHLAVRERYG